MQELEFEGAAGHGMWFDTSFTAAQQQALSQALPLFLGQEYDLKLKVLPALQGNTNFPGRNNHLKCYAAHLSLAMSAKQTFQHSTSHTVVL